MKTKNLNRDGAMKEFTSIQAALNFVETMKAIGQTVTQVRRPRPAIWVVYFN